MSNLVYLYGNDDYLLDVKAEEIINKWLAQLPDAEVVRADPDHLSPGELQETLEFNPLFALSRIVVLRDPPWLDKSGRQSKKYDPVIQVFNAYLACEPEEQMVLVRTREHFATNPVAALLKKQAQALEVKKLGEAALEKWLKAESQVRGLALPPVFIKKLLGLEQDMYYLSNVLDRLALMEPPLPPLPELEATLDSRRESKVFKLTDALLKRNAKASLEAHRELLQQGEPILKTLFMINQQFTQMAKVKYFTEQGWPRGDIEAELKMKEFAVRKFSGMCGAFTWEEIEALHRRLLEIDISLKSTSKDQNMQMELLILEFCRLGA
ncbi:MAG: DNA polymerase III subunit delta [Syntrophomonadaceae bacterium]|nr:DNA polymerase III subunit delta [Syntrophomonadaceae bacterium]